jgi:hypothetical protein
MPSKETIFEGGVIAGKLVVMILLVVFAFMNHETSFVCKSPQYFLGEAIAVGLGTAIPVIFIGIRRGNSIGNISSAAFIGFLVFFIFHILMEFSGENEKESSAKLKSQQKAIFWPVIAISVALGLVLLVLAAKILKFDMCLSEALLEAAVFGLFNTVPLIWIEYDRGESSPGMLTVSFLKYFFAFSIGCLILQAGGFWSNVFPLADELKEKYVACSDKTKMFVDSEKTIAQSIGLPSGGKSLFKSLSEAPPPPPTGKSLFKSLSEAPPPPPTGKSLFKSLKSQ